MAKALKILILEDLPRDAEAICEELTREGLQFTSKRIETAEELHHELDTAPPDVILSDFTLPHFDGLQALRVLQKRNLRIPFILVTGTRSEEVAVDCIKEGADDYILKASLMRLRSSIVKTLRAKAAEREKAEAEEALRELPRLILEAQETERRRVARDLHDSVNQILASAKFRIQTVEERLALRQPDETGSITQAKQLLDQAMQEVRRISHNLRPSELDDLGLLPAVRSLVSEFTDNSRLKIRFTSATVPDGLPKDLELNLYRVLQEALNNIRRHARASFVTLDLTASPTLLHLTIQDDGTGFTTRPLRGRKGRSGMGLVDMKERARLIGGSLEIDSAPGKGTLIRLSVPIQPQGSSENSTKEKNKVTPGR